MSNLARRSGWDPLGRTGIDPFRAMRETMRSMMEGLDPFAEMESVLPSDERIFLPRAEVKEAANEFVIRMDLPGVREQDIDVSCSGNRITVTGERQEEERKEGDTYYAYERTYGKFSRSFVLPEGTDAGAAKADVSNGVLCLSVPKKTEAQAKRIPVGGAGKETPASGKKPQTGKAA